MSLEVGGTMIDLSKMSEEAGPLKYPFFDFDADGKAYLYLSEETVLSVERTDKEDLSLRNEEDLQKFVSPVDWKEFQVKSFNPELQMMSTFCGLCGNTG